MSGAKSGFIVILGFGEVTLACIGQEFATDNGKENPTTVKMPVVLAASRRHSVIVQVRRDHIAAYVDAELVTSYKTDYSDVKMLDAYAIPRNFLGLATYPSRDAVRGCRGERDHWTGEDCDGAIARRRFAQK